MLHPGKCCSCLEGWLCSEKITPRKRNIIVISIGLTLIGIMVCVAIGVKFGRGNKEDAELVNQVGTTPPLAISHIKVPYMNK